MSLQRRTFTERFFTHLVLLAGAIIFAFPFIWMLLNSFKVTREMAADELQMLPTKPVPRALSPFIDEAEFDAMETPEDIQEVVWERVKPKLNELLAAKVEAWKPTTGKHPGNPSPGKLPEKIYQQEMIEGLAETLSNRISDEARLAALQEEKNLRLQKNSKTELPPDRELVTMLSEAAVSSGTQAILENVEQLVDTSMMENTFKDCYRRFCLGNVRVRSQELDYQTLYTGKEWAVEEGKAELVNRWDFSTQCQEVRLDFSDNKSVVTFEFQPTNLTLEAEKIKRIYVNYRGDESWASLRFEVQIGSKIYQTKEWANLHDREWIEQELRFDASTDVTERQTFMLLIPSERKLDGADGFAIRMHVEKNTQTGAWASKLTNNYRQTFREVPYFRYIMTSFSLAILSIILTVFSCTLVGYAFARLEWPGRDICFFLLLATMMIPPQVTMIPSFLVSKYLGWYNTLLPLWLPAMFGSPFFIFLVRQFLKNVPKDLEDAAKIDGCGMFRIYWHVMMPLIRPTIATIAIFTFMGTWNNFMGPLVYVNDERMFPLALGLFKFNLTSGSDSGLMMAGSFMMTLPIIILFFFAQRYFIQGISMTGTKG